MQVLDFLYHTNLRTKGESEKATLLCFYCFKETGTTEFSMPHVTQLFSDAGLNQPNQSRLKARLLKDKSMRAAKGGLLEFVPAVLQQYERELGQLWSDCETIPSNSEVLDETKFCGKRGYIDKLIRQINVCYRNNCYDASAVLMRRLFEVLLILAYQHIGIDNEIRGQDGTYLMLEQILANAINNKKLSLSRIKKEYDTFRKVGNFSAHRIEYTAGKKDIDDIRVDYRTALEELFYKAGLKE